MERTNVVAAGTVAQLAGIIAMSSRKGARVGRGHSVFAYPGL